MDMGMIAGLLQKIMGSGVGGGNEGGPAAKGGGGGGGGGGFASAPDPLQNVSPSAPVSLTYNPPGVPQAPKLSAPADTGAPSAPPADTGGPTIMRPRNNAGGDFWGPVVQRMLKQYMDQQRNGGGGFNGDQSGSPGDRAMNPAEYGKGAGLGGY